MSSPTVQQEVDKVLRDARGIGLGVVMNRKLDEAIEVFDVAPPVKPPLEKLKHGAL